MTLQLLVHLSTEEDPSILRDLITSIEDTSGVNVHMPVSESVLKETKERCVMCVASKEPSCPPCLLNRLMTLEKEEDSTNREEVEAKLEELDPKGKSTSHPSNHACT